MGARGPEERGGGRLPAGIARQPRDDGLGSRDVQTDPPPSTPPICPPPRPHAISPHIQAGRVRQSEASRVEGSGLGAWLAFSPAEWTAIGLSLKVATVGALISLPFGVAIAWLLARREFPGKLLLNGLVHLPLVLPPVVTGWLLLIGFGPPGPFAPAPAACCGPAPAFRSTAAA